MNFAFTYAQKNGVVPETDQPYKGAFDSSDQCANDSRYPKDNKFFVNDYDEADDCDSLKAALTK